MTANAGETEIIVRRHLQAFVEQQGLDAILADYADDACFLNDDRAYCGKPAIRGFFNDFVAALPPDAISQFKLHSLLAKGDVAYITWSAGQKLPLGTDTFVVRQGRIVSQTFAMYADPAN
ncbi:MAG: nuclear transport factor 2 family protein [Ramlibacter sp.]